MVIDCFPFRDELDLLELRLATLDPVVARFVIVESPRTYSNEPKPLCYAENHKLFRRWRKKIVHITALEGPAFGGRHGNQLSSGECLRRAAHQYDEFARRRAEFSASGDLLLIGDVDEIPSASSVTWMAERAQPFSRCRMRLFAYYLNGLRGNWIGTMAMRSETLGREARAAHGVLDIRYGVRRDHGVPTANGGWHFSFQGGAERVVQKIRAAAHRAQDCPATMDVEKMRTRMESGTYHCNEQRSIRYVPLDGTFPPHLLKNRARFAHMIRPQPTSHRS